ncbi:uncharacterized protein RJT21DRAFT_27489 [Scheffersomyces amazonensis]|uniref:uncharacterized protein n=1 Tax=Scheffersomyces amazonensis TaxID=1078765 RepID=UPI00315CD3F4
MFSMFSNSMSSSVSTLSTLEEDSPHLVNTESRNQGMALYSSSSGDETPSAYEYSDYSDDNGPEYTTQAVIKRNTVMSITRGYESSSNDESEETEDESVQVALSSISTNSNSLSKVENTESDRLSRFGAKHSAMMFCVQYLGKDSQSTYTKLIRFLYDNSRQFESSSNVLLLVRSAIACAYGGRKEFNDLPNPYSVGNLSRQFSGACSKSGELNVSLFCVLGHILLRYASQFDGNDKRSLQQRVPGCKYKAAQCQNKIGGPYIWLRGRVRGSISATKWRILGEYSRVPYDQLVADATCRLLGINIELSSAESQLLAAFLHSVE